MKLPLSGDVDDERRVDLRTLDHALIQLWKQLAVDKVVGWAMAEERLPLSRCVLAVSGRLSYEIVHKAVVAGLPIIIAVSAPSSLAVDLAERWRLTLCGFVRGQGFNVYSHPSRIQAS